MNAIEMEPFIKINLSAHNRDKFRGDNSEVIKILIDKLRAVLEVDVIYKHSDLGSIGPNGTLRGLLTPISDGKIDIGMNTRPLLVLWKVKYVSTIIHKSRKEFSVLRGKAATLISNIYLDTRIPTRDRVFA